jgi:hypothetical protein
MTWHPPWPNCVVSPRCIWTTVYVTTQNHNVLAYEGKTEDHRDLSLQKKLVTI